MRKHASDSYSHILKYTSLFGGVQVLTIIANLIRNKIMAIFLGTEGIGLNSMLYTAQTFASQCTNLGLSFGAIPRLSDKYEHGDEEQICYNIQMIRLWSMIAAALGLASCLVFSPLLGSLTFSWGQFSRHYAALGISVAALAIAGGETAILKATRHLRQLAQVQAYTALASVVISVPLYFFLQYSGILPAIIMMALFSSVATIVYSYRCYPLRMNFRRSMFHDGMGMLRLGVTFVIAAAIGSGSEMLIRSYLNVQGDLTDVGLYNAAYMIVITYAGMVFYGMEVDYFPRLSAVCKDVAAANEMVNKQMEVIVLMLAPMLVALITLLPILIPLLFSSEFIPVVKMAQIAVIAMYFKALTMPVSYINLARGRSLTYLLIDSSYYVVLVVSIIVGYRLWGIYGTGIAIVIAHVCENIISAGYAYRKYSYRCTSAVCRYAAVQMALGFMAFVVSCVAEGWLYWIIEAALTLISTAYSIHILRQKTHIWMSLRRKFRI